MHIQRSGEELLPNESIRLLDTGNIDRVNFLKQLDVVRIKFNELDQLSSGIHDLTSRVEGATLASEFRAVHSEFSDRIQRSNQIIKQVKSQIDALEVSNRDFDVRSKDGGESETNMRRASWAAFSNRLRSCLISFNSAQAQFDEVYRRRTGAHGLNLDLSPSPDASPVAGMGQVFADASAEASTIRREDMLRLEKSLHEIREAFLQIAALVESQGEMLDCIEFSIVNAKNYSHQANVQLVKARKKQRQKMWLIVGCVIFLVILVTLLVVFLTKS